MSAPLFPIPPLIDNGAGVVAFPTKTDELKSLDKVRFPCPAAVIVKLPFVVVANVASDPLPIFRVVADIPKVFAEVIVANPESDKVVAPDKVSVEPDVTVFPESERFPVPKSRVPTLLIFFVPATIF